MPNFIIEKMSKTVYGPFSAVNESSLVGRLISGDLVMEERVSEDQTATTLKVKELKEPFQENLFPKE